MRYLALFALAFLTVFSLSTPSQQTANNSGSTASTAAGSAMTPEKAAETRGDILMARKEYVGAVEMYQSALKEKPNNAMVLNKIGVAYQQLTGYDTAIEYYKRAAKADKKLSNPLNNLGTIEYQRQRYSKAVGYYKRALSAAPASAPIYSNLGYAYYAQKKYQLAMQNFSKAMAIDPTIFEKHDGTGGSIMQQRSAPDPGTFNFFLAKTYAKAGDVERAVRYLKLSRDYGYKNIRSVQKDPDFAAVIKDPRIQDILQNRPSFATDDQKPVAN